MGTFLPERSCISMKRINQIEIGSLVGANSGASDIRFCSGLNLLNPFAPLKFNNTVGRLAKPMEMRIAPSRQVHTVMSTLKNGSGHSAQSIRASSHQIDGSRQIGGFESPSRHNNIGALLFCKHGAWAEQLVRLRCNTALTASPSLYEPLLGENRELGEIPDSTLRTNPRLI